MCQDGWSGEYCENIEANSTMIIKDKPKGENIEANSKIIIQDAQKIEEHPKHPDYVCSWAGEIGTKGNEWRDRGSYVSDVQVKYKVPENKRGKWYLVASFLEPVSRIIWWSTGCFIIFASNVRAYILAFNQRNGPSK